MCYKQTLAFALNGVCVRLYIISFLFIIVIDQKQFIEPFVLIGVPTLAFSHSLTSFLQRIVIELNSCPLIKQHTHDSEKEI